MNSLPSPFSNTFWKTCLNRNETPQVFSLKMAFVTKVASPFLRASRTKCGRGEWTTMSRAFSTVSLLPSFYLHSAHVNIASQLPRRFFSESPHEFFPRILKDYKPSTSDLTKEALISELKSTKVSFERVLCILKCSSIRAKFF